MPRFFVGEIDHEQVRIHGEDARHIALSLRMRVGESVTVCDMKGIDYQCEIVCITPEEILLRVSEAQPSAGEPDIKITLFQAMPKGDKMELIVQKAVELGVYEIVPMLTERCVSRPDQKAMAKKLERYNRIAQEAAKQCGRGYIPKVRPMEHFSGILEKLQNTPLGIFFYENANTSLKKMLEDRMPNQISILIGSEGGFSPIEAEQARDAGLLEATLGRRILRCETASLAALTAILYQAGEM